MFKFLVIGLFCALQTVLVHSDNCCGKKDVYMSTFLQEINKELNLLNRVSSNMAWDATLGESNLTDSILRMAMYKSKWINLVCDTNMEPENRIEKRLVYLLCRGPRYSTTQARDYSILMENIATAYGNAEVCFTKPDKSEVCLKGEPDLEKLMKDQDLSHTQHLMVWRAWHNKVGPRIKKYYPQLVNLMNTGAIQNGYNDIGQTWREELEIDHLEYYSKNLYMKIRPLYTLLHAVIRHQLVQKYGEKIVDPYGKIPAHLLGNMWAQDWSSLISLFFDEKRFNLEERLAKKKWTAKYMVTIAEDFYASLGFPRMTDKFWKYSKLEKSNSSFCHGSAANMFDTDDYRMIVCAERKLEDFYVIHHEMGHIQYYMAYKDQPTIFQDGANSAFQEAIGDTIMLGVYAPQHLYRLGLINDDQIFNRNVKFYEMLLFYIALSKIPQIPYGLMLDLYRWDIFKGRISPDDYNKVFWEMNEQLRGIKAPEYRGKEYFDAGAKFHVADNTPYIRYFLSSFIQADIFKALCKRAIFGKITDEEIPFPLHTCDIYGSKSAGKYLKKFMSLGASMPWTKNYEALTGKRDIDFKSLLEYFDPLYNLLYKYVEKNKIPLGW